MDENYFRYYKPKALIVFILIFGTIINYVVNLLHSYLEEYGIHYIQYPTTTAILFLLIVYVNKKQWKRAPLKYMYNVPDVSGRYEGEVIFKNPIKKEIQTKNCALEVKQTGSKLKIDCYFENEDKSENTLSNSLVESLIKNSNDTYSLVFTYNNNGNQVKNLTQHYGTNILDFFENESGKYLKGIYYTNREPNQTKGEMKLKYITNKLKNEY